jgi:hypothetical protein
MAWSILGHHDHHHNVLVLCGVRLTGTAAKARSRERVRQA